MKEAYKDEEEEGATVSAGSFLDAKAAADESDEVEAGEL